MKTKYWIVLIAAIAVLCIGLSLPALLPQTPAVMAQIWSEGQLLHTVDLAQDQTLTVETADGTNTVTVKNGRIGVTAADCPDKHCISRGMCHSGAQIVCLPNRLVIRFVAQRDVDGVAG